MFYKTILNKKGESSYIQISVMLIASVVIASAVMGTFLSLTNGPVKDSLQKGFDTIDMEGNAVFVGNQYVDNAETATISYNLIGVSTQNTITKVMKGADYCTVIRPVAGYTRITNVKIMMGGEEITDSVFDPVHNLIAITDISGDIVINVSAIGLN